VLADLTHGGAWHIGVLAAAGIPEMLLAGPVLAVGGGSGEFTSSTFNRLRARSPP